MNGLQGGSNTKISFQNKDEKQKEGNGYSLGIYKKNQQILSPFIRGKYRKNCELGKQLL